MATWPRPTAEVRSDHRDSQINGPYFLLLTPQRLINRFIITLFSKCCKFIGEPWPSNTNIKVIFYRTWTEPMLAIWTWQIMLFEFQAMKAAICFWMESILLCHIHHMINNDYIAGHTVKINRGSRDPKEPIGNVY